MGCNGQITAREWARKGPFQRPERRGWPERQDGDAPTQPDDLRWFDLFGRRCTRRDFVRVGAGASALVALGALPARRGDSARPFRSNPFTLGVASGDPTPGGVVLWTRLDPQAVAESSGPSARVPVTWEIAEDQQLRRGLRSGEVLALPELGHSTHAEVEGLRAGREYFYRFTSGGAASPVGRTRTVPDSPDRLRLAFASCQNYNHGWFTAYRHMAAEDLDLVLHLGDYIYEGGGERNRPRNHGPGEIFTLDQYRERYAVYRTDPDLQLAHAAVPWVVTWDDHDVENNYAAGIPERDDPTEFVLRRASAYQSYYEFMPLRRRSTPVGPGMGLYRRLGFGGLASLHVLDTRQYRDDQACGDRIKPPCEERAAPGRTMLGDPQERWLEQGLRRSRGAPRVRWNLLAQQVVMAPLSYRTGEGAPAWSMDAWDGYPAARQRLLDAFASGEVSNPVVLTGDIHSSWVIDLHADPERPESPIVGTELVGTSITTNGDGRDAPEETEGMNARNPHVRFYDDRRGYVTCDVNEQRLSARFRVVPLITQPGGAVQTRAEFVVESGRPGAVRGP
jgi:alkaline phosphatase D